LAGGQVTEAVDEQRLQSNVIGPWGLAALVIGVTSPAIGLYATWGPIEAMAGPVVPLVFLAALIITLPTVLSYACLNRYAPSAGAAATWLWTALNPTTGLVAGLVMIFKRPAPQPIELPAFAGRLLRRQQHRACPVDQLGAQIHPLAC
jgi:amino acid transporter